MAPKPSKMARSHRKDTLRTSLPQTTLKAKHRKTSTRWMILEALELAVKQTVQALKGLRDAQNQALVVRSTCAGAQDRS
jgi:hypothetical protein